MTRPLPLLAALVSLVSPAAAAPPPPARAAVVVGANAAALGRAALRHAHRDSDAIADVLRSVGRFEPSRVHVLHDPAPDEVLRVVEREAAALAGNPEGMLLFYYSGHSDRDALYPGGRALPLDRLRRALDRADVAVRVGVIDACQGGGWTRAKGLVPDAPFEVAIPAVLGSEGSALIASSSGVESAHESDLLQGSFFTYHFAAALRGAGDRSGDGAVTLTEAFEYARERTIRDSARLSPEPQHPSYALNVRGRQDIVLAHVADSPSTLAVEQREGPLELVHLASGLRVLELPAGERSVTLAVPPGKYLVRKVAAEGIRTREIAVPRDGAARIAEADLVLLGNERLSVKGGGGRPGAIPARGGGDLELGTSAYWWERGGFDLGNGVTLGVGGSIARAATVGVDGRLGITDRLTWRVGTLAFAWGFGEGGGWEVIPWAGVQGWKAGEDAAQDFVASLGAGVGGRVPLGPAALVGTAEWEMPLASGISSGRAVDSGRTHLALGVTLRAGRRVTFHLAAGLERQSSPGYAEYGYATPATTSGGWSVGSIQELGLGPLPLVALHLPRAWSLNVYARSTTIVRSTENTVRLGVAKAF